MNSPRLLEIGCGEGNFLDFVRNYVTDAETYGCDINQSAVEVARSKKHNILCSELSDLISNEDYQNQFDIICMFQLLEHLADPCDLLRGLRRLLKPHGKIILGIPDAGGPISHFDNYLTEIPPHHISRWQTSTFTIGMPRLGYVVERIDHEPLPDYLWHTYLPRMWNDEIWPAQISEKALSQYGEGKVTHTIEKFINYMRGYGVKWLYGVPGHTLYLLLRRKYDTDLDDHVYTPLDRPKFDYRLSELTKYFYFLAGSKRHKLGMEEEAWFKQIKATTIFSVYESLESDLESRKSDLESRNV